MNNYSFFDKNNWDSWIKITYYSANRWKNYKFDYLHSHDRLEVLYVYYGEMTLLYMDEGEHETTLYSNDYVLIDSGIRHTVRSGDCDSLVFSIELKLVPSAVSMLRYPLSHLILCDKNIGALFKQEQKVIRLSDTGHVASIIHELQQCLDEPNFTQNNFTDLLISAMLSAMGNNYTTQQYSKRSGIKYLRKAVEYINFNYHNELQCAQVAEHAGISLNYLNHLFSEQFGATVNSYINRLRIREAMRLIERTDISLTDLYRQIGYKNNQNFSKQFAKHAGCSPSAYRKKLKESHSEKAFENNANLVFNLPRQI